MMGKDKENPWGKVAPKSGRVKMISELLDSSVMPGMQGGPLMHIISAKAIAFGEALKNDFKVYAQKIVNNAKTMAESFMELGYNLVSDGTDTLTPTIIVSPNVTKRFSSSRFNGRNIGLESQLEYSTSA